MPVAGRMQGIYSKSHIRTSNRGQRKQDGILSQPAVSFEHEHVVFVEQLTIDKDLGVGALSKIDVVPNPRCSEKN